MLKIQNLRPGEKIEIILKRHWIVYVLLCIYFVLAMIISMSLYFIISSFLFANMLNILFWLFMVNFLLTEWINHELDMYVVTNNRIIWIEQIAFLNRTVSECNLWQVQEVNSSTKWFFSNMLNYGTLTIQTAWNTTTMKMDFCPNSIEEARKILNIVDSYRDNQPEDKQWKK